MKDEYDFGGAQRGKFFKKDIKTNLPVYLDEEVLGFIQDIAKRRDADLSSVVNQLIRSDMHLAEVMK